MKSLKKITLAATLPLMMFASLIGNSGPNETTKNSQDIMMNIGKINIEVDNESCIDIENTITDKYVEIKR